MPPSPIPAPLPPWARWLLQLAPLIAVGLQDALQYIGTLKDASSDTPDQWRHVQIVFQLQGNADPADRYVTTMDIVNITNGKVDATWTDQDYTTAEGALETFIRNVYLAHAPTQLQCIGTYWYRRQFNPLSLSAPYPPSGPPERTFGIGAQGTVAGSMAIPQSAMTTTDRSSYPRHWGRNYWPIPASNQLKADGHFIASVCDTMAAGLAQCYASLMQAEFFPVVTVTQIQGARARGLLGVTEVQCDDVPDVVRRRRPHSTTYRAVVPVP